MLVLLAFACPGLVCCAPSGQNGKSKLVYNRQGNAPGIRDRTKLLGRRPYSLRLQLSEYGLRPNMTMDYQSWGVALIVIHKFSPRRGTTNQPRRAPTEGWSAQHGGAAAERRPGSTNDNVVGRGAQRQFVRMSPRPKQSAVRFGLGTPPSSWRAFRSTDGSRAMQRKGGTNARVTPICLPWAGLLRPFGAKWSVKTCA